MVICIDLDGVIAMGESNWPNYESCKLVGGVLDAMQALHAAGYRITIYTSRNWEDVDVTYDWLVSNNIPFDNLVMGKPQADLYIDDKGIRITNWREICERLQLPLGD